MRMQDEGAEVTVVGLKAGETYVSKSGGLTATTDAGAHDVSPYDFDAVLIPGGWAPNKLGRYQGVLSLTARLWALSVTLDRCSSRRPSCAGAGPPGHWA